jgi:hypothetical protein
MESTIDVLSSWPRLVDCCDLDRSTVIFEGATMNFGMSCLAIETMRLHLPDESHQRNNISESCAEREVLTLSARKCDLSLQA